jgi:hypothetical protein
MTSRLEPSGAADADLAPGLAETMVSAGLPIHDGDAIPMFNAGSIAAALVDRAGAVVCESPAFHAIGGQQHIDEAVLARVCLGAAPCMTVVELTGDSEAADTAIFAYGSAAQAKSWRLPPEVQAAAARHPGHAVILTSHTVGAGKPLQEACRSYGLSGLQTRVALETIRCGNARLAARAMAWARASRAVW